LKKKIDREIEPTAKQRKYNTDERSIDIDTQSNDREFEGYFSAAIAKDLSLSHFINKSK